MRILALDSSTRTASVAVIDDERIAARESGANTHSETLIVLIDECLAELALSLADLDGVAIGAGPGSFTGLRIGMATAKGLCFAADKPLWLVSSLAAVASNMARAHKDSSNDRLLVPILDARRKEVFVGFFREDSTSKIVSIGDEIVIDPQSIGEHVRMAARKSGLSSVSVGGDGVALYSEAVDAGQTNDTNWTVLKTRLTPSATAIARLAIASDRQNALKHATPAYIRLSEAEIKFPDGNPGGSFSP